MLLIFLFTCLGTVATQASETPRETDPPVGLSPANAPKAVVANNAYTFEQVLEGEIVTHAFVIENQGSAPLEILDIRTSCGCTTARQPKAIEPGSSSQIEVKGDTRGYGGHVFDKTITVFTNDPSSPQLHFKLKGTVALFARIEPTRVVLRGEIGTPLNAQAIITQNPEHPFRIVEIVADRWLAEKINIQLNEQDGRYLLTIDNRQATPGQYRGRVILKTDSTLRPQLFLYVIGDIKA